MRQIRWRYERICVNNGAIPCYSIPSICYYHPTVATINGKKKGGRFVWTNTGTLLESLCERDYIPFRRAVRFDRLSCRHVDAKIEELIGLG